MATIIEGVHCDVSQDELKAHCARRVEVHTGKWKHYEGKLTELVTQKQKEVARLVVEQDAADLVQRKMSGYSNYESAIDQEIERAKRKASEHKVKAQRFRFWGEHLPADAVFRLNMSDLGTLELTDE